MNPNTHNVEPYQSAAVQPVSSQHRHHNFPPSNTTSSNAEQQSTANISSVESDHARMVHGAGHVPVLQPHLVAPAADDGSRHQPEKKRRRKINRTGAAVSDTLNPITASNATATAITSSDGIGIPRAAAAPTVVDVVPSGRERRRKQMRMAQRAYRQRKQTEFSSLESQLSEKDNIIARMKTAFDALNSKFTDSNILSLYPALMQPVQDISNAFEELSQIATENTASSSPPSQSDSRRLRESQATNPVPRSGGGPSGISSELGQQHQWTGSSFSSNAPRQIDLTGQVSSSYADAGVSSQSFDLQSFSNPFQQYIGNSAIGNRNNFMPDTTTLPTPTYIAPPATYSFQETTFARRLIRICMERAQRILLSGGLPTLSPKEARVFNLAYRFWSREHLIEKFTLALSNNGVLYDPTIPFLPIGGAGTHYLHAKEFLPLPSSTSSQFPGHQQHIHHPRVIDQTTSGPVITSGPFPTHLAHIRHDGPDTTLNGIVSSLGLLNDGSDWFDAQDIDSYLREMGICLEPHSSYFRFSLPANPTIASTSLPPITAPTAAATDFPQGTGTAAHELVPAYINVERFIDSLTTKAMCLGRTPGFRKRDVEELFYDSIET